MTYVVGEALAGRHESLKESVIGAEVFGRAPGFETSSDSIVRVKATEVRLRLAKYYKDRPVVGLHIELPTGSYVPVFHQVEPAERVEAELVAPIGPARLNRRAMMGAAMGGVGVGLGGWTLLERPHGPDPTIRLGQLVLSRQAQTSWPTVQALVDGTRMLAAAGKPFQVRVAGEMSFDRVNG